MLHFNNSTNNIHNPRRSNGSVKVNVYEELKASITGSGDVYYSGNPIIISNIKGTGNLIKINAPND